MSRRSDPSKTARRLLTAGAVALAAVLLTPTLAASAATSAAPTTTNDVVVMLKDGRSSTANARQHGLAGVRDYPALNAYAARLTGPQVTAVRADPDVQMVVPNHRITGVHRAPKPFTSGVRRISAQAASAATNDAYPIVLYPQFIPYNIDRVQADHSATANIDGHPTAVRARVAVVDTGVQRDNPELNVVGGVNCSESNPGDPSDYGDVEGHGTEVAGVLAAEDNDFGVVGVAPGAAIYSVRVLGDDGGGELSNVLCGVNWITAHAGLIQVANLSLIDYGSNDNACGLRNRDALHFAICRSVARGITYVAAAGNDALDVSKEVPAGYPEVITVSGFSETDGIPGGFGGDCDGYGVLDPDDHFASFSNFGRTVDIAAPAECIYTDYVGGQLVIDDGTSFAAPAVSGAAALLLTKHPSLSPLAVRKLILNARVRGHIAGDPDRYDEGILDVEQF